VCAYACVVSWAQVDFKGVDILADQELRDGVKVFSSWPTYPQLYVKGELVGGCDIVLEMQVNAPLYSPLPSLSQSTHLVIMHAALCTSDVVMYSMASIAHGQLLHCAQDASDWEKLLLKGRVQILESQLLRCRHRIRNP